MTRKRVVRFNEKAQVVCAFKPPAKVEVKSLWYTKKELKRIRRDIKREIKGLSLPGCSESEEEEFQWRGLERLQTGTMCLVLENQQALVQGVLNLQELHRKLGLRNGNKAFTMFVCAYNKDAMQRATRVAKQDFAEALEIYRDIQGVGTFETAATPCTGIRVSQG